MSGENYKRMQAGRRWRRGAGRAVLVNGVKDIGGRERTLTTNLGRCGWRSAHRGSVARRERQALTGAAELPMSRTVDDIAIQVPPEYEMARRRHREPNRSSTRSPSSRCWQSMRELD